MKDVVVTIDGTKVAPLAGPGQPNWTYQATLNAIVFNLNTDQGRCPDYRPAVSDWL